MLMPAIPAYIIEPIWQQLSALLPRTDVDHPLGCHRPRIPDRVAFQKLVQVLVFGCAYERIADESCSATTLRRRRDEWIEAGSMEALKGMALESYDRIIGLELSEVAVDWCIQRRLRVEARRQAEARWIEERGASNAPWALTPRASLLGLSRLRRTVTTRRF
jgi:transposase